jgi:beta-glucanase (GH16 family)
VGAAALMAAALLTHCGTSSDTAVPAPTARPAATASGRVAPGLTMAHVATTPVPMPMPTTVARPVGVLAFHETFDGPTLDNRKWTTCYWWGDCTIVSNGEAEWYQPAQASVAGGLLHLEARAAPSSHLGRVFPVASGMVSTGRSTPSDRPRFAFTYGTIEVRFRTTRVQGLWPAIWMLPVDDQSLPEVDLIEVYGLNTVHAGLNLHPRDPTAPHDEGQYVSTPDLSVGWHSIRLEWSRGRMRWILDGVERHQIDGRSVPSRPMYLLIDLAAGGIAGPVDDTHLPATLLVDQVNIWTRQPSRDSTTTAP